MDIRMKIIVTLISITLIVSCYGYDDRPYTLYRKGLLEYNVSKYTDAITNLSGALAIDEKMVKAYLIRGHAYAEPGKLEFAISDYSSALEYCSNYPEALFYRGLAWFESGDSLKAISDYNVALELNVNHIDAIVNKGWAFFTIKRI
jgi:tetratricopeptide (TPR) repeat protein